MTDYLFRRLRQRASHGRSYRGKNMPGRTQRLDLEACSQMLGNIKNPPEPFKDIILTHFRLKSKSITKQLDEWLKQDDGKALSGQGAGYQVVNAGTGNQAAGPAGSV